MSKESKIIIKEVRDAIKSEKYTEAIEKCEILLKDDPKSYMAYLLLGAAYQNRNKTEAANYLRQAVHYSPGPPTVALQGLANCAPLEELPKICEQLLDLLPEKYADYYEKIFQISDKTTTLAECFKIFKKEVNTHEGQRKELALKYLGRIWVVNDIAVEAAEDDLYKTALQSVVGDSETNAHLSAYKRYLKLLYKERDLESCIKHACSVVEQYPDDIYAYEWICKIYCEEKIVGSRNLESQLEQPIEHYSTELRKLNNNSSLSMLVEAFDLCERGDYIPARDKLYTVRKIQPNYPVVLQLLAKTEMELCAYAMALPLWEQLREKKSLEYAICLSHESDLTKVEMAIDILLSKESSEKTVRSLARCYFKMNDEQKLKELNLDLLAKAEYLMSPETALSTLQASTEVDMFSALLLCGKLQYRLKNYVAAITAVLKATKLKPHNGECFFYLGKIYYAVNDISRTRKCLEKCVNLNPLNEEAVNILSGIYQQLGEEDLNVAMLLNTLKYMKSNNSKLLYYKLGLHYLSVNKWDDAIQSFRTAIKYDVHCMTYWESLGDGYVARGSYNSAIRVFQKILEMDPQNTYSQLQIAVIKTTIRMYAEAVEDFRVLLKEHPDYLPGLKGAAEAHIGLANNLKADHRYGGCKEHLQKAVNYLQRVFFKSENRGMVWLWRLTGSVFLQTAEMPTSMAYLEVSGKLVSKDSETTVLDRKDLLQLATRFYTCAVKIKQNTYLWYELALSCYRCAENIRDEAESYLTMATKVCQRAIKAQPSRWQNWNLLGVIYMHEAVKNFSQAQHCFIQALMLERKSYTTWTNLGVLYLISNNVKLGNQAFQRAQQSSPIYRNAWIGQAMIAEAIAEDDEALDLFRHCQQFEYHPESTVGYAHWVCKVLKVLEHNENHHYRQAIKNMHADIVALDAINWYVKNEEDSASLASLTIQGFLNNRQKLYRPALKAYEQSVKKATCQKERDQLLTAVGFLHLKLQQPDDAIKAFNSISNATFEAIIGLARAYADGGQSLEAYSIYNSVLSSVAGSEDDKAALVLVAMASLVYLTQGEQDTKTILYQCILLSTPPIEALYAACALGIMHKDNELTENILTVLKSRENKEEFAAHIAFLKAQYYLANRFERKAVTYLQMRVRVSPHWPELRRVLAEYFLDNQMDDDRYQVPISRIALSAIELSHRNRLKRNVYDDDAALLIMASRALATVNKILSLKLAQRAIHMNPLNLSAWSVLRKEQIVSF